MTVLADTNVLIDQLRDRPEATRLFADAAERSIPLCASAITKVELLAGMRSHERSRTRRLLDSLRWIDVSDSIAERAGKWARRYRESYPNTGIVDYVIAATAESLDAELWTLNVRHFPMFPELRAPY